MGKVSCFAGESGSGKSYIVSGNIVRNAQKMGILPVILDSEFALDEKWLKRLGVDTSPEKLMRFPVSLVDECATLISDFMDQYLEEYKDIPEEERQGVLFIIDSLGMLSTPSEAEQFQKGDMKGDMGRKAKQLKALVTQCLKLFGPHKIGLVATNHTYRSQDMFNPEDVISGGSGFIFASSIIVSMNKLKLKVNVEGEKVSEVLGIRSKIRCVKSRYAKPFEEVEVHIPYDTGMDPYSGLVDLFEKRGLLTKSGNFLEYVDANGEVHKAYRKDWLTNHEKLKMIMDDVEARNETAEGVDETPVEFEQI